MRAIMLRVCDRWLMPIAPERTLCLHLALPFTALPSIPRSIPFSQLRFFAIRRKPAICTFESTPWAFLHPAGISWQEENPQKKIPGEAKSPEWIFPQKEKLFGLFWPVCYSHRLRCACQQGSWHCHGHVALPRQCGAAMARKLFRNGYCPRGSVPTPPQNSAPCEQ